jgi:hypothetical protein
MKYNILAIIYRKIKIFLVNAHINLMLRLIKYNLGRFCNGSERFQTVQF